MIITTAAPALVIMRMSGDWSIVLIGTLKMVTNWFVLDKKYLVDSVALNNFGP